MGIESLRINKIKKTPPIHFWILPMNSKSLKLLGIILFSMIPFTFVVAELYKFEKIVYDELIYDNSFIISYGGLEYENISADSTEEKYLSCLVEHENPTSNNIMDQPEYEKIVYKRSIEDGNNKTFFDIDLEYYRMKGDSTIAKNFNCLLHYSIYQNNMSPSVPAETPEDYVQIAIQNFEEIRRDNPNIRTGYYQKSKGNITWSDDKLISLELISTIDTGGAHPHADHYFLNVDPKTGKQIDILDFISDMEALRTTVQEKLIQELPDGQKQLWDQVPLPKHMGMTEKGLKLVYNEYEILAYSFGRTVVLIPMGELKQFSVF